MTATRLVAVTIAIVAVLLVTIGLLLVTGVIGPIGRAR